ncbi:MAG: hypothetical protein Kow0083_02850 [Methylophaga sp.]
MNLNERTNWVRLLMGCPASQVCELAQQLSSQWPLRYKSLPQSGLGMMKLRDGAMNEPFYLGEIPLASAWVELTLPSGDKAEGAAQLMSDDQQLAEAVAICDAVLANRLEGAERIMSLLQQGHDIIAREKRHRKQMLQRTRVDFSLLDAVEDNDEEN